MKKNKNAFTLIELLAIIVILAIIALITIPNISQHFDYSKRESIKRTVDSLVRSYEYKELNSSSDIGRQDACNFQDGECTFNGYLERNSEGKIVVYINTPKGCASGTIDNLKITGTTCGGEDTTPPIIKNMQFASITTDSITVLVQIEENESMIESARFRLLDKNGNPISGWQDEDYTYETDGEKISKKTYSDLTL